jgi:hypothetical protein
VKKRLVEVTSKNKNGRLDFVSHLTFFCPNLKSRLPPSPASFLLLWQTQQ